MFEAPPDAVRPRKWRGEGWPLFLVVSLAGLFFCSFFNRFIGLRSGAGEYGSGVAFLAGRMPYRDYFTAGPPFNQLKSAALMAIFGKALLVSRVAAVVERLAIASLLYFWLRRTFSRQATAIAALVTIIVSAGDRTDPLASYNHDAILFAILCGYAASVALDSIGPRKFVVLAALSGCAAGFSTLTKQTVGLTVATGVLVVGTIACQSRFGLRRAMLWFVGYGLGAVAPVLPLALYLRHRGLLFAAIHMLFVSGPAAKASRPADFLARDVHIAVDGWVWLLLGTLALAMSAAPIYRAIHLSVVPSPANSRTWLKLGISGFLLIAIPAALALTPLAAVWNFSKGPVYYAFIGTGIVGVAAILAAVRPRPEDVRLWQIALLATVGWCVAFALSLSWPVFEAMALPGLGLMLAATVDGVRKDRPILYALLAVTVFFQVREKLDLPFGFDYQDEPSARFATQRSAVPALRGMRLPAETVRLIDETTATMGLHGSTGETVFTYPEMAILYALSGASPPTWSGSHNIDVVSDPLAREDAQRLLRARPGVILYAKPAESQLREQESTWRHGAPSGQRDLVAALDCLVADYRLVDTFQLRPEDNPIRLYERKPDPPSAVARCPIMLPSAEP